MEKASKTWWFSILDYQRVCQTRARKKVLRKLRLLKSFVICAPPSPSATQWLWVPLGMRRLCCRNSGFLITRAASAVFLLHCGVLIDKQVPDCIIWFASPGMCVWFTLFLVLVKFHTIFGYIWVMHICHMLNWIVQFLNIATNLEMDNLKKKLQGTTEKDMNRPSHPSESSDKSMNITAPTKSMNILRTSWLNIDWLQAPWCPKECDALRRELHDLTRLALPSPATTVQQGQGGLDSGAQVPINYTNVWIWIILYRMFIILIISYYI